MDRPLGIQLYTLGDDIRADVPAALRAVAEIGFREVELPHLYGQSATMLRGALDSCGLRCPSIHVQAQPIRPGEASLQEIGAVIADAHALGADYVAVPIFPMPARTTRAPNEPIHDWLGRIAGGMSADDWRRIADMLNERGALLARENIRLGYHNHNLEFVRVGETTALDLLFANTDPALVGFQIDTGWVAAAGADPAALITRYHGRVQSLHLKDIAETQANTALTMNPADVGAGRIEWARVLSAAKAAGVEHYFIEQEPPFTRPRLDSVRSGFQYIQGALRELGAARRG